LRKTFTYGKKKRVGTNKKDLLDREEEVVFITLGRGENGKGPPDV